MNREVSARKADHSFSVFSVIAKYRLANPWRDQLANRFELDATKIRLMGEATFERPGQMSEREQQPARQVSF